MSKTNCVNCGSAKDTSEIRCPFCGTTYLDFTAIDFTSGDPVVCQFVLPYSNGTVLSMVARPVLDEISMTQNTVDITSLDDTRHHYLPGLPDINVNISFIPIARDNIVFSIRNLRPNERR